MNSPNMASPVRMSIGNGMADIRFIQQQPALEDGSAVLALLRSLIEILQQRELVAGIFIWVEQPNDQVSQPPNLRCTPFPTRSETPGPVFPESAPVVSSQQLGQHDSFTEISRMYQPTVGVATGLVTEVGCRILAACDTVLATENARFWFQGSFKPALVSSETARKHGLVRTIVANLQELQHERDNLHHIISSHDICFAKELVKNYQPCRLQQGLMPLPPTGWGGRAHEAVRRHDLGVPEHPQDASPAWLGRQNLPVPEHEVVLAQDASPAWLARPDLGVPQHEVVLAQDAGPAWLEQAPCCAAPGLSLPANDSQTGNFCSKAKAPAEGVEHCGTSNSTPAKATTPITTMMICNIPCRVMQQQMANTVDALGFAGLYDLLYLPLARRAPKAGPSNLGYGFINLLTEEHAMRFMETFQGHHFEGSLSSKRCTVKPAHVQGLDNFVKHFAQSPKKHWTRRPLLRLEDLGNSVPCGADGGQDPRGEQIDNSASGMENDGGFFQAALLPADLRQDRGWAAGGFLDAP